ncbi:uncharacterized transmembrane protein DDB_G0289901-like isoform X2 [Mytilus californianus]|uniref:uncharacterized transmembrane protein DDB_G0289901-like isoform X2 n=1 Tax=Mytilus californianus TaxID=6549 RepID=UPI002247990E|nr:uncharacterized transmembrane protein DDB_G0289901-like isoform X2 [Mytilus californianus]
MHLSLQLLLSVLGLSLADDIWNFGDWDDDYSYNGYQPTGLLRGGSQSFMRYPTYRSYNRGSRGVSSGFRGNRGGSSGFRGSLGSTGLSYNTGYSQNKGYGSYGNSYSGSRGYGSNGINYGSGMLTTGSLGTSIRPSGRSRYYSKSSSIIRPRGNIGNNFGIRSLNDDDDFDDINIGVLGPSVARAQTGSRSVRPTIKNHQRKSAIRPLINNVPSPINIGRSFDNDEDEINRGVLGPAVVRSGGSRASIRPIAKKTYHRKLASVRTTGSAGVAPSPVRTSFDDNGDDFDDDNGILGFSSAGRPSGIARKISPRLGSIGRSSIGIQPSFGNDRDDFDDDNGILGFSSAGRPSGIARKISPRRGSIGGSSIGIQPSFDNDRDDFDRDIQDDFNGDFQDDFNGGIRGASINRNGGILGASVNKAGPTSTGSITGSLGPAINRGGHSSQSKSTYYHRKPHQNIHVTHVHKYRPDYDEDNFGSAPVFNSRPLYGGYAGYGTQYPQYGSYGYRSGNSYANGGGFGSGNFGGGSGFRGRFRGSGGGSGGRGGSGSGGGESDDFDFDDDESGSSGSSGSGGGFGGGFNGLGGIGGVAGRFVGGGFGSVGGIGSIGGNQGRYYGYGVYPNSKNINHYANYKNSYRKSY